MGAMDIATLSFSLAVVGAALAVLTGVFAAFRGERGLTIYALGFVCAVASFLLFMSQGFLPKVLSIVAANMLLVFYQLSLAWGLRARLGAKPSWPSRFSAYVASWFAFLCYSTWIAPSFTVRAGVSSLYVLAGCFEFLYALRLLPTGISPVLKRSAKAIVLAFIAFHSARFVLILAASKPETRLLDPAFVNVFSFSMSLFFSVLWAGLIMAIDAADLLSRVEAQNEALEAMATTDGLTGLLNRYSLEAVVPAEIERAARYGHPLSLILFDIDHFKKVNDTWGHDAGDRVLKKIADVTKALVRKPDDLFRWGGEEFMALAPHTALDGAVALAEKLRAAIKAATFDDAEAVSASFGVAQLGHGERREDWFKRADRALYRAKNLGRDRVVSFGAGEASPIATVTIEWKPEWDSGDETIDAEHRRLVELSNGLFDLALSRADAAETLRAVDDMLDHVALHFRNEEAIIAKAGFPDAIGHARLHGELVTAAKGVRSLVESGDAEPAALFDFLVDKVVIGHMIETDSQYFPYLGAARQSGPGAGDGFPGR